MTGHKRRVRREKGEDMGGRGEGRREERE